MKIAVAIDGPAAAGKSTIAKRVAEQLGMFILTQAQCIVPSHGIACIRV